MADPISIFSIIGGSAALALQVAKAVNDLHTLAKRYKRAELIIQSLTSQLSTIQWAWRQISTLLEAWNRDEVVWQDDSNELFDQINRTLQGGTMVIAALEEDLRPFLEQLKDAQVPSQLTSMFRRRARIVWNNQTFKDHQERIRDQVNSMNLLISIMQLYASYLSGQRLSRISKAGLVDFTKSDTFF